jgi:hypothetical protein
MMDSDISRFPFPLHDEPFRYYNNSIPLHPPYSIEVTPEYLEEITLKRRLLHDFHPRCYQSLPDTYEAQWEVVQLILHQLMELHPDRFRLEKENDRWTFINRITNERQEFVFGDRSTLPYEPLDFVGRHVQEDIIIMMQKDGDLILEACQLCFPVNWSLFFKLGMTFIEIHEPVPGFNDTGLADKIQAFLTRIEAGKPWMRRNWGLTVGHHLDTAPETFHEWGQKRKHVTLENAGSLVHLRVEVQKLFRLPRSNAILFTIHTHMLPLEKLAQNRKWLERFYRVMADLPEDIADYKGIKLYKDTLVRYLEGLLKDR